MKLLDSVREQAKGSKDLALKENISNLYNDLLDLKAHTFVSKKKTRNCGARLRRQRTNRPCLKSGRSVLFTITSWTKKGRIANPATTGNPNHS